MNELKSYTEYAVSTPTADFVIGFDFNYGEDAVNVTVDDVPATEAGYTVVYLNETTIRLSPSVPSGVVRLQRETDIDQTDHAYRAGAKFIAQTMDENFEQLRHSQQEVRDGFVKLAGDTHEIIDGLDAALELAQDAASDAQEAAVIAQGAADTVNTIIVGDKVGASNVLDASGETQQQVNYNGGSKWHSRVGGYLENERVVLTNGDIVKSTIDGNVNDPNVDMTGWVNPEAEQEEINYLIASEGVNILSVYGGVNDFGVALELAFAKTMTTDCRKIIIPDGVFSAKTTADLTLSSNFTLQFSGNTAINADNRVDVINVTQGVYTLNILGNGASIYPNWSTGTNDVVAIRLNSQTLGKSLLANNINVFAKDNIQFTNGINAAGLNYSRIVDCTIQAINPIVNASALSGTSTHAMGTEVDNCKLHAGDTVVTLINNGELGCEGWKFKGGEYFGKTGLKVIDNLDSASYFPPLLLVDGVHMNAQRFFSLSGISKVKIANCNLQSQVTANSEFKGLIEFDGVQVFDIDETTDFSQAATTGTIPADSLPVYYLRQSPRARDSAFLEFGVKNYWLVQSAPLVAFDSSVYLNGRINLSSINTTAFTGLIVSPDNASKVRIASDTVLRNSQVATGVSTSTDITFDSGSGILTLNRSPSIGYVYQLPASILPDNSTINQIKVSDNIGKEFTIIIDASNVTINHSANLYTPIGVSNKLIYGSTLRVVSYNSDLCRILSISNHASILPATVPVNSAASGIHGQTVLSGGFVYMYFRGQGWVRWAASTF